MKKNIFIGLCTILGQLRTTHYSYLYFINSVSHSLLFYILLCLYSYSCWLQISFNFMHVIAIKPMNHYSVSHKATFSSINLVKSLSVWLYQSLTSLWEHFLLTLLYKPQCFSSFWFVAFHLCTTLSRSRHRISIMLRSGLSLCPCSTLILFFSPSVVDLLLCLGSLSCCMTQFWPSFSFKTDSLTFDTRICCNYIGVHCRLSDCKVPRSSGCKASPNHHRGL